MAESKGVDKRFLIAPAVCAGTVVASYLLNPTDPWKVGYLYAVCINYGMTSFFTILSSPIMLRELPRSQFGKVQSKLFPVCNNLNQSSIAYENTIITTTEIDPFSDMLYSGILDYNLYVV